MATSSQVAATLKGALRRQFGPAAHGIIDYEVDSRVAASSGRLRREDLDEIEGSVLAAMKQKRKTLSKPAGPARSTPALQGAKTMSQAFAPASSQQDPKPPSDGGSKRPPALQMAPTSKRSGHRSSAPLLLPVASSATKKVAPIPPFGLSLTTMEDPEWKWSPVQVQPKYEVPLASKLKPVDHWDLIVAFDTELYRKEEANRQQFQKGADFRARRAVLDKQVEEKRLQKERDAEATRLEREVHRAQVQYDAKMKEEEQLAEWAKRDAQRKNNEAMAQEMADKRERQAQKKRQECKEIVGWLQAEKERKAEELRLQRIEHARKCKFAQDAFKAASEARQQRKLEEQEREMQAVAEAKRYLDEAEAKNRAAVAKRESRVAAIAGSLGAHVAKRDADEEQQLHEKVQRVLAEQDRKSREDAKTRKDRKDRLTREMLDSLDQQIADRGKDKLAEKEADRQQVEIFRRQLQEQNDKNRREALQAQQNREELDKALIEQIRRNVSTHPKVFGLTADIQRQELAINRLIYEHMAAENFCPQLTKPILEAASDTGRLEIYPSVGRCEEPIHPLELQVADA